MATAAKAGSLRRAKAHPEWASVVSPDDTKHAKAMMSRGGEFHAYGIPMLLACNALVESGWAVKVRGGVYKRDLRRAKAATKMGATPSRSTSKVAAKKRTAHKRKPDFVKGSLRWKFCMRLRELAQGRDTAELAKILGVSGDLARKYLGGTRVPTLDEFPAIAEAFGLSDWTDLFRPKNS